MKFQKEAIHRTKRAHQKILSDLESVLGRHGGSVTKLNKTPKQQMGRKENRAESMKQKQTTQMKHRISGMKTPSSRGALRPPHTQAWLWSLSVLTGGTVVICSFVLSALYQ